MTVDLDVIAGQKKVSDPDNDGPNAESCSQLSCSSVSRADADHLASAGWLS
jgi:hypothetical protein